MNKQFLVDINPDMELPKYELILYRLTGLPISSLKNINNFNYKAFFIGIDEISFNIPAYRNESDGQKVRNEIYDLVDGEHYILLNNKKYFIIDRINEKADDGNLYKEVHAYSREFELSQKKIVDYKADSRVLYDSSNTMLDGLEKGILNYIFNHVTKSWSIGNIDINLTLNETYRALDFPNTNLIQVFQELQKIYNCIFIFDTINQKIDVISMDSNIGENKGLYISDYNFIKSLSKNIEYDKVKTRLFVYGKDNISIQSISPAGQPYLDNFDAFKNIKFMTQDLINALDSYQTKVENYNPDFQLLLTQLQQANQVMESLINADSVNMSNKGLVALERALSNVQTLIDVKVEELAIIKKSIDSVAGRALENMYNNMKSIQSALYNYENEKSNINTLITNKKTEIENQQGIIDSIKQEMADLQYELGMDNPTNFTTEQLKELDKFIRIETYNDSNYTENNIVELYKEGKKMLSRISQPAIQFDVSIIDFLSVVECQHTWKNFILGDIITLEHKELGFDFEVRLVGYEHNYENNSLDLKFSNNYTFDDDTLWMRDLLEEINTTATAIDFNKYKWDKTDNMESNIAKLVDAKLEETRQSILNAVGQKYLFDYSGLWLYKENPDGTIDPKQIRAINNTIGLTKDNFNTVSTAITPDGVVAESVYGKLGKFAQVSASQIIVGDNGETIPDEALGGSLVKQNELYNGVSITTRDGLVATRNDNKTRTVVNATDGIKIQTSNGSQWTDSFYVDTNGQIRARNMIIEGLERGSKIFNSTPSPPYSVNDLWRVTNTEVDFKICTRSRASGSFNSTDWVDISNSKRYIDNIKNLSSKEAISGGIVTIDSNKIRVSHGSGQYSEIRADGFYRQWENGKGAYLNDIFVGVYNSDDVVEYDRQPPPVRIELPDSFRNRGDSVEIFLSVNKFKYSGGSLDRDGRVDWLTRRGNIVNEIYSINLGAYTPYVDVLSYIKEDTDSIHDRFNRTFFQPLSFLIMIIGR